MQVLKTKETSDNSDIPDHHLLRKEKNIPKNHAHLQQLYQNQWKIPWYQLQEKNEVDLTEDQTPTNTQNVMQMYKQNPIGMFMAVQLSNCTININMPK